MSDYMHPQICRRFEVFIAVFACAGGRQQVHEHQTGRADGEATEGHCQEGGWHWSYPQAFEDGLQDWVRQHCEDSLPELNHKNTSKLIQTDLCRQQRLPGPGRLVQGLDNQDLGEERQREHDQRQLQTNMVNPKTCKTLQLLNCSLFRFFTSSSTQSRKATRSHSSKKKLPLLTSLRR